MARLLWLTVFGFLLMSSCSSGCNNTRMTPEITPPVLHSAEYADHPWPDHGRGFVVLYCCGTGFNQIVWRRESDTGPGLELVASQTYGLAAQPPMEGHILSGDGQVLRWMETDRDRKYSCTASINGTKSETLWFNVIKQGSSDECESSKGPEFRRADEPTGGCVAEGHPFTLTCSATYYVCPTSVFRNATLAHAEVYWLVGSGPDIQPLFAPGNSSYSILAPFRDPDLSKRHVYSTLTIYDPAMGDQVYHCELPRTIGHDTVKLPIKSANVTVCPPDKVEEVDLAPVLAPIIAAAVVLAILVAFLIRVYYLHLSLWFRWHFPKCFADGDHERRSSYDAFVAHASSALDERVVCSYLVPFLEGESGKRILCLPMRDFGIGENVPMQLVDMVRSSRQVIAVLSPAFYTDGWCDLAVSMAIKRRIPIVFVSIPKDMPSGSVSCSTPPSPALSSPAASPLPTKLAVIGSAPVAPDTADGEKEEERRYRNKSGSSCQDSSCQDSSCHSSTTTASGDNHSSRLDCKMKPATIRRNIKAARSVYPQLTVPRSVFEGEYSDRGGQSDPARDRFERDLLRYVRFTNRAANSRLYRRYVSTDSQMPMTIGADHTYV